MIKLEHQNGELLLHGNRKERRVDDKREKPRSPEIAERKFEKAICESQNVKPPSFPFIGREAPQILH